MQATAYGIETLVDQGKVHSWQGHANLNSNAAYRPNAAVYTCMKEAQLGLAQKLTQLTET